MKRALDIVRGLSPDALRGLAARWKTDADPEALASAMRGERANAVVRRACNTGVVLEDALLLLANPFDAVERDELHDAEAFVEVGLVAPEGDAFAVNVDVALAALADSQIEFGFVGTLLARLAEDERAVVARAMEVGARPTPVETVLDTAAASAVRERLIAHVARLREDERAVVREALELGDLPDDVEAMRLDTAPARVRLDPGPAGQRGLVYRVAVPAAGVDERAVVPLELSELLPSILAEVPPPPEPVASRSRRGAGGARRARTPRKRTEPSDGEGAVRSAEDELTTSGTSPVIDSLTSSGVSTRLGDPIAASGPNSPFRVGRVSSIEAAGGVVDLDTATIVEAALADEALRPDVMRVLSDALVVLRPGVDPKRWAERCALRLGL